MKRFTPYKMGRNIGKFIAAFVLVGFLALVGGAAVEFAKAECATTQTEQAYHADRSDMLAAVALAFIVVPAIHSMRLTNTLGFSGLQRVFVPELGLHLTHAELAIWNFITKGKSANEQLKRDLINNNLRIQTFADSIKCTITNQSGNKEIFSAAASTYRQGRIPEIFNNAELPEGTIIALSHIALGYATDASATVPEADVDYSRVVTAWPVALANGELLIHQNGIKQRFMCKAAGSQGNSLQSAIVSDGLEFASPVILEEKKQIKFELRYAEGQSVSNTNNHFLDICMRGAIISRKS